MDLRVGWAAQAARGLCTAATGRWCVGGGGRFRPAPARWATTRLFALAVSGAEDEVVAAEEGCAAESLAQAINDIREALLGIVPPGEGIQRQQVPKPTLVEIRKFQ